MLTSASNIASIALAPNVSKLSRMAIAAQRNQHKQNRKRREKELIACLKDQVGQDIIEVPLQKPGEWFYGITHDYMAFAYGEAREMYPDKPLYIYRTDETLVEFSDSLTGETFPCLDVSVTMTQRARDLFLALARRLGTINDQAELVAKGYMGCAASYYTHRYALIHVLNKYGDNRPDTLTFRPIVYIYDGDDVRRECVDTKLLGQGGGIRTIPKEIDPSGEMEQSLFAEILTVQEWS